MFILKLMSMTNIMLNIDMVSLEDIKFSSIVNKKLLLKQIVNKNSPLR